MTTEERFAGGLASTLPTASGLPRADPARHLSRGPAREQSVPSAGGTFGITDLLAVAGLVLRASGRSA